MNFQFIILAAGKGTRMNSELPKVLVDLKGKPLIQWLLDNIKPVPTDSPPIAVIGFQRDLVQAFLGGSFTYALQTEQLGTANAVASALPQVRAQNVLVLYGDMPFIKSETLVNLMQLHVSRGSKFSMLTATVPTFDNPYVSMADFGRIIRDDQGKFLAIRERSAASGQEKEIREVNPGIYAFNVDWLKNHIDKVQLNPRGEYYLTDLVEIAVKEGMEILTAPVDPSEVFGVNTEEQLKQAEVILKD